MGLGFTVLVARSFWSNLITYSWTATECTVLDSKVAKTAGKEDVELELRYRYRFAERDYTSTRVNRGITSHRDSAEVYRLSEQLRPGTLTTCYVNPSAPEEAVMFRESLWTVLIILFPLVFVGVGAGGIFFAWRQPGASPAISQTSLSSGSRTPFGARLGMGIFFGVFLLVGAGVGYGFFLKPLARISAAKSWNAVLCTIVSSRVVSHSGKSTTYSVEVVYRYTVNGQSFTSARYKFMSGSSSGYGGKAAAAALYPPGKTATCYVNPRDPADAVLERGFTADLWFGALPLAFAVVGGAGLWFVVFRGKKPANAFVGTGNFLATSNDGTAAQPNGELPVAQSRLAKLTVLIVFAVFWNAIVSVFVVMVALDWRRGEHPWFLSIFLIPFVAIGLFVIGSAFKQALALSNPRPRLTLRPLTVFPGETVEISWMIEGKTERLQNFVLTLEGREEATYRRGTNTSTDKNVFLRRELANRSAAADIRAGTARVTLPADTMHSWAAQNNRVVWSLQARGKIPRWPDLEDEFALTVAPRPLS